MAKSAPDGNTILITSSAFVVNTSFPESGYNAERDFIPVTIVWLVLIGAWMQTPWNIWK